MALSEPSLKAVHLGSIAGAVVLAVLGVLVFTASGDALARLWVIAVLLVLLGVQVALFLRDQRVLVHGVPAEQDWAPAPERERMVIRCKECGEVFPVDDTGERPLVATCPHCGKSGAIKVKHDVPSE